MAHNDDYILDILLDAGLATRSQIEHARAGATANHRSAVEQIVVDGVLSQEDVSRTLAAHSSMDFVDLSQVSVSPEIIATMPVEFARRYRVVPVANTEAGLVVAISDPLNFETLDSLRFLLKREVELVCATEDQIKAALIKYYGSADDAADELMKQLGGDIDLGSVHLGAEGQAEGDSADAPIIKMVSSMILEAHRLRASDIHIEPLENRLRVRFRIDGVMQEMQNPPKKLQSAIVSRIKIMTGSMSIAEKRLPQDGRIQVKMGKNAVDLRVSTIPCTHGESVVMRILDKTSLMIGMSELGFLSDDQEIFERLVALPDGILLVTGPTGSGKTTTLYACLNYINKPDRKIITVEDPVEYQMTGINQVQVLPEIGMDFPRALRSILRQAPNIIMIGEIRDAETANIAINASLTGHLVLSTLHTNDAPSAVARLVDIGVQPFLVSSSIRAIMAQRLVRKNCANCRAPHEMNESELSALNIDPSQTQLVNVMKGTGCELCRRTGYKGRMGIFEIFLVDDEVRRMVNERSSTIQLRERARQLGMRTLREDGVRKVLSGLTTPDEVITSTMSDAN